jgi:hypothetical protein
MFSSEWERASRSTDVWRYLGRIWELRRGNIRCICKYGTVGQKWPQYKGLSPTPLAIKKYL